MGFFLTEELFSFLGIGGEADVLGIGPLVGVHPTRVAMIIVQNVDMKRKTNGLSVFLEDDALKM